MMVQTITNEQLLKDTAKELEQKMRQRMDQQQLVSLVENEVNKYKIVKDSNLNAIKVDTKIADLIG